MARNPVQFQKGISLNAFLSLYGTEDQCFDALYQWRWAVVPSPWETHGVGAKPDRRRPRTTGPRGLGRAAQRIILRVLLLTAAHGHAHRPFQQR